LLGPTIGAGEWLEPDAGRPARPVLRGRWRSNALPLPDIGVDAESGLVHTVAGTAANVHDIVKADALLHGEETIVFGDAGYRGIQKRTSAKTVEWMVAMCPGKRAALDKSDAIDRIVDKIEYLKASVRAKVEHPVRVIKQQFGFAKVRYRGLKKNTAQLITLFALSNLWMARRKLLKM
jgi:IS5 family transposase